MKAWAQISLQAVYSNHYIRSVAVLAGGTSLVQLLSVAAVPVLTRLYTPAEFGVLALFLAIVSSVTPAICGRYEVAVVVSKTDVHAEHLVVVSVLFAFGLSLLGFMLLLLLWKPLHLMFNLSVLGKWLFAAPVIWLLSGIILTLQQYSNRIQRYGAITRSKLLQATVSTAGYIIFGFIGLGQTGLLLGNLIGVLLAAMWLTHRYWDMIRCQKSTSGQELLDTIKVYRDFPLYNASTAFLNGITLALPVFFLSRFFSGTTVGFYSVLIRVVQTPLNILSNAVAQVHLKNVAEIVHEKRPIRPKILSVCLTLLLLVIPFTVVVVWLAPDLFALLFGENWRQAGVYLQILMPAIALRFVVSSISTTLGGTGNNRLGAVWRILAFVITAAMFSFFAPRLSASEIFYAMLITESVVSLLLFLTIWRAAGSPCVYDHR